MAISITTAVRGASGPRQDLHATGALRSP
jgi:hypothetical protein